MREQRVVIRHFLSGVVVLMDDKGEVVYHVASTSWERTELVKKAKSLTKEGCKVEVEVEGLGRLPFWQYLLFAFGVGEVPTVEPDADQPL